MILNKCKAQPITVKKNNIIITKPEKKELFFVGNPKNNSELISEISRVGTQTAAVLGCLSPTDLDIVRPSVRSYEDAETIRWHILHAIEHFGRHLGHLELTRQLYAERSRG